MPKQSWQSILHFSNEEARTFFLKGASYCTLDLPSYFDFGPLLQKINEKLAECNRFNDIISNPRDCDNVNYTLYHNKDGKYAWRPLSIIHPVFYVNLVRIITENKNWEIIRGQFKRYAANKSISCISIPVESQSIQKDKAEQILRWVDDFTRQSLTLSLEFKSMIETDITDCYSAIYTHSIAWALHGKETARSSRRDASLLGNQIDTAIQDIRYGQTNGIPQGSILMDFIAEMVLGYADTKLSERIKSEKSIGEYRILRYRDDYRIFVNDSNAGNLIVKYLTEVLIDLGLKLNSAKTRENENIVASSLKKDKLIWIEKNTSIEFLLNKLLLIHKHSLEYPNSGSVHTALCDFLILIENAVVAKDLILPLTSIAADIAYGNPRTIPVCITILDTLLRKLNKATRCSVVEKIIKKFNDVPNTEYLNIWLQRMTYPYDIKITFETPICQLITDSRYCLWNMDCITSNELKRVMQTHSIIDKEKLVSIKCKDIKLSQQDIHLFRESSDYTV